MVEVFKKLSKARDRQARHAQEIQSHDKKEVSEATSACNFLEERQRTRQTRGGDCLVASGREPPAPYHVTTRVAWKDENRNFFTPTGLVDSPLHVVQESRGDPLAKKKQ